MRRLLLVTLLSALAALLLLSLWRPGRPGGGEEEAVETHPQLFYALEAGRPLILAVGGDARRVKLVALASLGEEASGAGPDAEFRFGLRARLLDASGEELWETPIWLRSRVSAGEPLYPGGPGQHRATLATGDDTLTDERVVELALEGTGTGGGELLLEALEDSPWPVMVRPLRHRRTEDEGSALGLATLADVEREELAERVGVGAWHALDPSEKSVLSTFHWQRMEARGARGRDYVTRRVVLTDLRGATGAMPPADDPAVLAPGRAMALNLRGPARVQLELQPQASPGERSPTGVSLVTVSQRGEVEVVPLEVDEPRGSVHGLQLPAGSVTTVSVFNRGPQPLRVVPRTQDAPGALFAGTRATLDEPGADRVLAPEIRRLAMVRLGADPVRYALRDGVNERLRIEARPGTGAAEEVAVELLDAAGAVITRETLVCEPGLSPYETVPSPDPQGERVAAGAATLAELWTGGRAAELRLSSAAAVDVRVLAPLDIGWGDLDVDPTYAVDTEGVTLRYEPQLDRRWSALVPEELDRLQAEQREVFLAAQVRLEPTTDAALRSLSGENLLRWRLDEPHRQGHAWFPEGELPRQRLLERWASGYSTTLAGRWPDGARTALPVGRATSVDRTEGGETRLALWLRDDALLGSTATLQLDGRDLARVPLTARQIELPVGPIPQGAHELLLDADGDRLTALVDLPPGDGDAARAMYRERTVYRLSRGQPVRASLPVSSGAEVALYLLPYYELAGGRTWPSSTARCQVRIESAGGREAGQLVPTTTPDVLEGELTPAAPLTGFLADRSDRSLVAAEPIRIALGDDVAGGRATVSVERLDDGEVMWMRLVALGVPPQPRPSGTQWVEELGHRQGAFAWADPFEPLDSLTSLVDAALAEPRGEYRPPSEGARVAARELGWRLAGAARGDAVDALPALAAEAQGLGFELRPVRVGDRRTLVLQDASGDGRGLLLLRFGGTASRVILQAPHAFHDRHTGEIALALWEASSFPALQINTRHRYVSGRGDGGEEAISDLAKRDDSWFQALMLGILDAVDRPLVVQIHGYGRTTVEDTSLDVIASGGAYPRAEVVDAFVATLRELAPAAGVAAYPDDTGLLGAQLNRQGRAVAARPGGAFLHVEIGPELRDSLRTDASARSTLLRALALAAEAAGDGPTGGSE